MVRNASLDTSMEYVVKVVAHGDRWCTRGVRKTAVDTKSWLAIQHICNNGILVHHNIPSIMNHSGNQTSPATLVGSP